MAIYSQKIREHNSIFERRCNPNKVHRVLVLIDNTSQRSRIGVADKGTSIWLDTDTEVPNSNFHLCISDKIGDGDSNTRVYLGEMLDRVVFLIV